MSEHFLVVEREVDTEPDLIATLFHPEDCHVSLSEVANGSIHKRYECGVQFEIENAGYTMFEDQVLHEGTWRIDHHVREIRGSDWTEYDGEWTVVEKLEVRR